MRITDYTSLKELITKTINRSDLAHSIEAFIQFAEDDLSTRLRTRQMEATFNSQTVSGVAPLPDDFRQLLNIDLPGTNTPLEPGTRTLLDNAPDAEGTPRYYVLEGEGIRLYPTPPDGTVVALRFYSRIPALTTANPTNWLIDQNPQTLLYGALIHTAPYLEDDPRLPAWTTLYERGVTATNQQAATELNPATLRVRPVMEAV